MTATALRMGAHFAIAGMLVDGSSNLAIWGVLITSVAGLVAQFLKSREDAAREERRHKFEMDDRKAATEGRAAVVQGMAETKALTAELGVKADAAFNTANHVNDKILRLASAALDTDRATEIVSTANVRADIQRLADSIATPKQVE